MSKKEELIARWDGFLAKIKERFEESLVQGEEAVLESLNENDYDYYASSRTLHAIKTQIDQTLIDKIDETWSNQVEPAMEEAGIIGNKEMYKGYNMEQALRDRLERFIFLTEGKLAQKYYNYAIKLINKDFFCTQCKAPLKINKSFFKSQYVPCEFCNTVNTFEPETKYAQIGWNVIDNIAKMSCLEEYDQMNSAQRKVNEHKPNTSKQLWEDYKKSYQNYHEKYLKERVKLLPEAEETFEKDLAKFMTNFELYNKY